MLLSYNYKTKWQVTSLMFSRRGKEYNACKAKSRSHCLSVYELLKKCLWSRITSIMLALFQNSPNDLQMLSDAPAHQLFCLLPPVPPTQNSLPEVLAVVQVRRGQEVLDHKNNPNAFVQEGSNRLMCGIALDIVQGRAVAPAASEIHWCDDPVERG